MSYVWLCGMLIPNVPGAIVPCGIYSTRRIALTHCTTPEHFIAPMMIDAAPPTEAIAWPGFHVPGAK